MVSEEFSVKSGWVKRPEEIDKLAPALVKAQGMIGGAAKDTVNPQFGKKYADLSSVWAAAMPALQANGLAVIQPLTQAPPGYVGVRTILLHESGQSISDVSAVPFKDITNPQAAGSAITYARRYALSSLLGICPEDDDGNAAKATTQTRQAPTPPKEVDWATITKKMRVEFESAKSKEAKKALFLETRGSNLPEPLKTEILTEFGNTIKGMK